MLSHNRYAEQLRLRLVTGKQSNRELDLIGMADTIRRHRPLQILHERCINFRGNV